MEKENGKIIRCEICGLYQARYVLKVYGVLWDEKHTEEKFCQKCKKKFEEMKMTEQPKLPIKFVSLDSENWSSWIFLAIFLITLCYFGFLIGKYFKYCCRKCGLHFWIWNPFDFRKMCFNCRVLKTGTHYKINEA
jgi:hypothetical protein